MSQTFDVPTWMSYSSMIRRTQIDGRGRYLGMEVELDWLFSFQAFLDDLGVRPAGHSLDRIDVNRGYVRGNCRWATPVRQARNKTNTLTVEYNGEIHVLADLCDQLNIDYNLVRGRLKIGMSIEDAIIKNKRHCWTKILCNGVEYTLREYCEALGASYQLVRDRLRFGWNLEDAVSLPKGSRRPKK